MRQGSLIAPIIVAIGVIAAAVAFAVVSTLLDTADSATDLRLSRLEERLDAERAERERLAEALKGTGADLGRLRDEVSLLANRAPPAAAAPPVSEMASSGLVGAGEDFENQGAETEALTEEMRLAKTRFNRGITQPRNRTMLEILGSPRESYSTDCQSVTNPRIRGLLETRSVGPITVTMLRPALDSLERVMARLQQTDPDIYDKVGTAGALCARLVRGSTSSISNHSWGSAIDLTLEGELDRFADGGTQFGLLILAEYFNDEGWYWGATYNREDSMHFEVGEEMLRAWLTEGSL
jgi:hypothetical protein